MAQTTRVLESRRFLKLVYVTILSMISLVLVIIALIMIEDRKLKDEDQVLYESIITHIGENNLLIQEKQEDVLSIKSVLEGVEEDDNFTRREQLTRLIDANNDIIQIADRSITELQIVDTLSVSPSMRVEAESMLYIMSQLKDNTVATVQKAQSERNIVQYYIEIDRALICYDEINTDKSSSSIRSSVEKCHEFIESATANLNTLSKQLTITNDYVQSLSEYWFINVDLHNAIEAQDEQKAKELTEQLNEKSAAIVELKARSEDEIGEYLSSK